MSLRDDVRQAGRAVLDFVAPLRCVDCARLIRAGDAPFCQDCLSRLPWWRRADGCPRCGWNALRQAAAGSEVDASSSCPGCYSLGSALHRCQALLRYEGPAQRAIRLFKSGQRPFGPPLAAAQATEFFVHELSRRLEGDGRDDLLVPIPLHRRKHRSRGFNQSALIARRLARLAGLPCAPEALIRQRDTQSQAHQKGDDRRRNLRQAFRIRPRARLAPRVWLVDDVLTTGATLEAAAECLLAEGVDEVHGLTLAATLPGSVRRERATDAPAP